MTSDPQPRPRLQRLTVQILGLVVPVALLSLYMGQVFDIFRVANPFDDQPRGQVDWSPKLQRLEQLPYTDGVAGMRAEGDWQMVRRKALELIRERPGHLQARFWLSRALESLGDVEGALEQMNFVLAKAPGFRRGHLQRARLLRRLARHDDSTRALRRAEAIGRKRP